MKKLMKISGIQFLCLAATIALLSFSFRPGGDSYEISIGGKVLTQQRVANQKEIPNLTIEPTATQESIVVSYDHCGVAGTARTMAIKDANDKVLKEWHFMDVADVKKSPMVIKLKEVANLDQSHTATLRLYYSSRELPAGRILANFHLGKDARASIR